MKTEPKNPNQATARDIAQGAKGLKPEPLVYWRRFTADLGAEGRLYRADLTALRLACVAMAILDEEPNLEHLVEARAWLVACGLTPGARGPKAYTLPKGEPIGSCRKDSKVPSGGMGGRV